MEPISSSQSNTENVTAFVVKWVPRAIAVAVGGYYGLGIAYEMGLMALIDQVAIQAIKHVLGYGGVGAIMPTAQWYSAWGLRIAFGIAAGILYDLVEKIAKACLDRLLPENKSVNSLF